MVADTLLVNHIPLQSQLIGAREHESHYVFDIRYHNTTVITPSAITGDMHSVKQGQLRYPALVWYQIRAALYRFASSAQAPVLRQ